MRDGVRGSRRTYGPTQLDEGHGHSQLLTEQGVIAEGNKLFLKDKPTFK